MDKIRVTGGSRLVGRVEASGAKNAALPQMAASLLTDEVLTLENIPYVRDILTMRKLLVDMGVRAQVEESGLGSFDAADLRSYEAPYDLVKTMRASVLTLGPLLARVGRARVSLPGGCAIGSRPVNLHLTGLEKMGADCEILHGYINATTRGLRGAHIVLDTITVTGTENLLMAATLAKGETVLENAAREPEIGDLADLLRKMGAKIEGDRTGTIRVQGVSRLTGCRHRVIPDRIEAGTYAIAAAITRGEVEISRSEPNHLGSILEQLSRTGAEVQVLGSDMIRICGNDPIESQDMTTRPFPGFPTDMQAQYMALMTQGNGVSVITETIFENRFMHALEMKRMGADVTIEGPRCVVRGGQLLSGANVQASDLRASASLILAALVAHGETMIHRVYHLDRGYARIEQKLRSLGATMERIRS